MSLGAVDKRAIRELAKILVSSGLSEIEYEVEGARIRVARSLPQSQQQAVIQPVPQPIAAQDTTAQQESTSAEISEPKSAGHCVTSQMVGTIYLASEPGAPPYKKVGDSVKEGEICMQLVSMKMHNPIKSPKSGTISEIHISDADPVEYGTRLFSII